jgi:hypothetical protein
MEILGSGAKVSPDPRRNTSKSFFEAVASGNKAATCCRFVSALVAACCHFVSTIRTEEETKWQQDAASALINSTNGEGYDVR